MAEENMNEENQEAVETQKNSKAGIIKLAIIGTVVIILVAAVSFVVAMYAAKTVAKVQQAPAHGDGYGVVKSASIGTTYDAGEYITNLNSKKATSYIKVKIVFSYDDAKVQEELANKLPEIQHIINSTLRQQTPEFLAQPDSMAKLSELLRKNVNSQLIQGNITNVYFTSFVVQ